MFLTHLCLTHILAQQVFLLQEPQIHLIIHQLLHVVCNSTKDTSKNRGITLDCIEPKYLVLESKGDIITYDKCFEAIDIKYIYLDILNLPFY